MARTIGKRNIKKLQDLTDKIGKERDWDHMTFAAVFEQVPLEFYEIWESAAAEINRVINDRIAEVKYGINTKV